MVCFVTFIRLLYIYRGFARDNEVEVVIVLVYISRYDCCFGLKPASLERGDRALSTNPHCVGVSRYKPPQKSPLFPGPTSLKRANPLRYGWFLSGPNSRNPTSLDSRYVVLMNPDLQLERRQPRSFAPPLSTLEVNSPAVSRASDSRDKHRWL